jgi:hypothetical protein
MFLRAKAVVSVWAFTRPTLQRALQRTMHAAVPPGQLVTATPRQLRGPNLVGFHILRPARSTTT